MLLLLCICFHINPDVLFSSAVSHASALALGGFFISQTQTLGFALCYSAACVGPGLLAMALSVASALCPFPHGRLYLCPHSSVASEQLLFSLSNRWGGGRGSLHAPCCDITGAHVAGTKEPQAGGHRVTGSACGKIFCSPLSGLKTDHFSLKITWVSTTESEM